uniref:OadG family transporter subunit n=1 Tax=Eubacterium cellulosolvens TaxID=29322 RepID=UPI000688B93E|nr:OadG family transporter subunit [[Eubacterium] cellulosolvens]
MKTSKRKISLALILSVCMMLLIGSVPVFAEEVTDAPDAAQTTSVEEPVSNYVTTGDETKDQYLQMVDNFLQQVYKFDDAELDSMEKNGGAVYKIFTDSWKENKDVVGKYVKVVEKSVEIDKAQTKGSKIVVKAVVKFEKYKADVTMYFDEENEVVLNKMMPSGFRNYEMTVRYPVKELMTQAAQNMVVGLLTVFSVLVILIFVIWLFRFIPNPDAKSKKAKSDVEVPAKPVQKSLGSAKASPAAAANGMTSDTEIAAVIAAALAAAMADEPSESGYVVRSVRKVGTRRWKRV